MTPPQLPAEQPTRLCPREGDLYAVRWLKGRRGDVAHRYFRRRHDAETYATKLRGFGKRVDIFESPTTWSKTGADGAR